jgi:hypothetical protein
MATVYPENHKKYTGAIRHLATGMFQVQIVIGNKTESRNFESFDEAESYKMQRCSELGFVKNVLTDHGDYYEMELTQGKTTKVDKASFNVIDSKVWHVEKRRDNWYVPAHIKGSDKLIYLHNVLMNFAPNGTHVVDHINRDSLDNRLANLRIVDITTNNINQGMRKDNVTGTKGVHYSDKKKAWIVQWSVNGKRASRQFPTAKHGEEAKNLALNFRKNIEEQDPVYARALGN